MVGRKKANMLEAFEASGTRRAEPAASVRAHASAAAKGAKPAAGTGATTPRPPASLRPAKPASPRPELTHAPLPEPGFTLPFSAPTFILVQLGLIGVAFFLGHQIGLDERAAAGDPGDPGGASEVGAAGASLELGRAAGSGEAGLRLGASQRRTEPDEPESRASAPRPAGAPAVLPRRTPEEEAFFDPHNQFTVQAASYAGTQRELAEHWAGQLREAGFPALVHPVGRQLAIYVGADAGAVELESLVSRVADWRAPDGSRPFSTCRIVGLDGVR